MDFLLSFIGFYIALCFFFFFSNTFQYRSKSKILHSAMIIKVYCYINLKKKLNRNLKIQRMKKLNNKYVENEIYTRFFLL